jgi:major vault protein
MLGPDEMFTVVELSGGKPKREKEIQSLCMLLGPDFMTDVVEVETADHARLSLQLAYNWHFEIDREHPEKLFQVPDFVGDACKAIASRVRGAVAQSSFDSFHKTSADIIRAAVFGKDSDAKIKNQLRFNANLLVVDNIDIQSVEPVDQRTRDSLQKSVQLAIEITTKAQEAEAKHKAELSEQQAKGRLERQKMKDEIEQEKARKSFLELQVASTVTELCSHAMAEARARADAAKIEGEAGASQAKLKAQEIIILQTAELEQLKRRQAAEVDYAKDVNALEVDKALEISTIEAKKFSDTVNAIGADTIESMARAGPEMQAKLLQSLGLSGYMITDGKSPINLFSQAAGMIGGIPQPGRQ